MPFSPRALVAGLLLVPALAACDPEPTKVAPPQELNRAADAPPLAEPPPMIVRQPSYRCDDGGTLYLSVLTDESFVTLRDRLNEVPTRLDRDPETGVYAGGGRRLSGTGDTVRYASAERPEQECRIGA